VVGGDDELRLVLVNAPPDKAKDIARALVEKKLAACVNVVPRVASFYFWDGALQEDEESTLLVKTRAALMTELTAAVKAMHPYTVPEVIAIPIDHHAGNQDYLAWLRAEARGTPPRGA
jgi:periplasmic divalent cation tolerance protein